MTTNNGMNICPTCKKENYSTTTTYSTEVRYGGKIYYNYFWTCSHCGSKNYIDMDVMI